MAGREAPDPEPDETVSFNVRVSRRALAQLDAWVADLNRRRRIGPVTRSEVVRVLVERGAVLRPSLEEEGHAEAPLAVLQDETGREVSAVALPSPPPATLDAPAEPGAQAERWVLVRAHYQRSPQPRAPVRRAGR